MREAAAAAAAAAGLEALLRLMVLRVLLDELPLAAGTSRTYT